MQCAKHNVGHISISCIFIQMCTYMASNIRNFNSFHTIMYQVGSHLHIVNMENSFCLSFSESSPPENRTAATIAADIPKTAKTAFKLNFILRLLLVALKRF